MTKRSKPEISDYILQRGTGKAIERKYAIVYDFMPVILGDMFRTNEVLSKMRLREPPVDDAPFILKADAYETLGLKYISDKELIPAMECYRIAIDTKMEFKKIMTRIQDNALLTPKEMQSLDISSDLERKLVVDVAKRRIKPDKEAFNDWVSELKEAYAIVNDKHYIVNEEYVNSLIKIGHYKRAIKFSRNLGSRELRSKAISIMPTEILDMSWLRKYIDDNHPESTFGGGW